MKKNLLAISLISVLSLSTSANALYVGGNVGVSKAVFKSDTTDKLNASVAYSFVAGMELPVPMMPVRAEVEYLNLRSKLLPPSKEYLKTNGFGVNAYVGLPLMPILTPYIGFGLNSMKQSFKVDEDNFKSKRAITPQYMIGLDLDLPLIPVAGGIEYRYMNKKFDYDVNNSVVTNRSKINMFLAKLRVKF